MKNKPDGLLFHKAGKPALLFVPEPQIVIAAEKPHMRFFGAMPKCPLDICKIRSGKEEIMRFETSFGMGTYGSYRKSKMIIDALNILLAIVIVVLFVALIFLNDHRSMLFPLIFAAGGVDNALAAVKNFMNYNKIGGIVLTAVTLFLFVLTFICLRIR